MGFTVVVLLFSLVFTCGQEIPQEVDEPVQPVDRLADTDLVLAFVIFRHGDRTPDEEELELDSVEVKDKKVFFPYGMKALTNKGKQRAYKVGQNIRSRYDGLISKLYLPDEIVVRTTDYARTKMTALAALAAMYPPPPAQRWNPALDWQPVPYDTLPYDEDDLLYWYNCPRYLWLRDRAYELPEVASTIESYRSLFQYISSHTGTNVTTPEQVFFLDNLFQTLNNVNIKTPTWAMEVLMQIKAMTIIEYSVETFSDELNRLASGVLMAEIVNATDAAIAGNLDQPKLRLYSAHENNVAALMAAARVFIPHQPNYGATFALELRRHHLTGEFGMTAVYAPVAGEPEQVLNIKGCGDDPFCNYDKFVKLTEGVRWSRQQFKAQCPRLGAFFSHNV